MTTSDNRWETEVRLGRLERLLARAERENRRWRGWARATGTVVASMLAATPLVAMAVRLPTDQPSPGDPISSAAVWANFDELAAAVNTLEQDDTASALSNAAFRKETANCNVIGGMSLATDCTCNDDEVAISGGACAGAKCIGPGARISSTELAADGKAWRIGCQDASGAAVACVSTFALCVRVVQ